MATSAPGARATRGGVFARKSHEQIAAEAGGDNSLKRALGPWNLTALGIGAIIGTGIFVIIGEAIGTSGPALDHPQLRPGQG